MKVNKMDVQERNDGRMRLRLKKGRRGFIYIYASTYIDMYIDSPPSLNLSSSSFGIIPTRSFLGQG